MMRTLLNVGALIVSLVACATPESADVAVPAPTGVMEQDRAAVQSVLDSVRPGQTVQFAAGRYVLGAGVRLTVPDVTIRGHPDGTVLRGCEPGAFAVPETQMLSAVINCAGFYIEAERQTVRGLTFEYMWHGILVGAYPTSEEELAATQGVLPPLSVSGQRIEGNTFRALSNGVRFLGIGDSVSVVRDNAFIDNFHAIGIYGPPVHFVGNRVRVENACAWRLRGGPRTGESGASHAITTLAADERRRGGGCGASASSSARYAEAHNRVSKERSQQQQTLGIAAPGVTRASVAYTAPGRSVILSRIDMPAENR